MTYYNLVFRAGHARMAGMMAESGVAGAIIPDLPLEELDPWAEAADAGRRGHRPAGGAVDPRRPDPGHLRTGRADSSTPSGGWG